jgi:hypothetical protein
MPTTPDRPTIAATRLDLQAVAEHVLAAALHAGNGHIGLRQVRGGFGTPLFTAGGAEHQLRVDGTDLVVATNGIEQRAPITTLRAAADLAGIEPGAPADVYTPVTSLEPDRPLRIDATAAARLATFFAVVDEALEELRSIHAADEPAVVQLWPEHFDLATSIGEVNYGGSPGDTAHEQPYLYVGPWTLPEPAADAGTFWNEPFGASRNADDGLTVDGALAFFREARTRLG